MKIVIINHTFQNEQFCKRWKLLAESHKDWDITLIAPSKWKWGTGKAVTFGTVEEKNGFDFESENFHVVQVKIENHKYVSWTSKDMIRKIENIEPDCIYHIGSHTQESLIQIYKYKRNAKNTVRVYVFSMRGPQQNLENICELRRNDHGILKKALRFPQLWYEKFKVGLLNRYCDAVFCHYPDAVECFRKEGFTKPVLMQTQVGVDTDVFYPDREKRERIRDKYHIDDSTYVFASAVRFNPNKGVLKILEALPQEGNWKYILMGSGLPEEIEAINRKIDEKQIRDKVILTGFVPWDDMAEHWNAADCAIHFTQTSVMWIETFSLSLVQAMATGLPVIGSTSGSVPYQIGPNGSIVSENDVKVLHDTILWYMNNRESGAVIGKKLMERTVKSFSTKSLNDLFYKTVTDLLCGTALSEKEIDMAYNN